jgi:hypothetical protein
MSLWRISGWGLVAFAAYIPINWLILSLNGDFPKENTLTENVIGTVICWGFAAGLGFLLVLTARGRKLRKAEEARALQRVLSQPLTEIHPTGVMLKSGERAYGAIAATLKEVKTVGYSGRTSGISVRVAKGVTLRSGGIRGSAVKGMVSVASGELVITNQRVIFAGDMKSFEIPLDKLLNTTNFEHGFGFSDGKHTFLLKTDDGKDQILFGSALDRVLRGEARTVAPVGDACPTAVSG